MPISLSKRIGPDSFSVVWGSLHLLHNESVTFPVLPVPIYTPGWRGVIMVKCLTQVHNTLIITGLEPTTFCLWIQHCSTRPHMPTQIKVPYLNTSICYFPLILWCNVTCSLDITNAVQCRMLSKKTKFTHRATRSLYSSENLRIGEKKYEGSKQILTPSVLENLDFVTGSVLLWLSFSPGQFFSMLLRMN